MSETAKESVLERFERRAEAFYRATGYLRPGKDVPAAMPQNEAERYAAWDKWDKENPDA